MAHRLLGALRLVERAAVLALFALMLGLFLTNIGVRSLMPQYASSISWAEEAARIAMIWGVFLIAGITLERGRHIAMHSLIVQLRPAARRLLRRVIGLSGAMLFGYLCWLCLTLMQMVFRSGQVLPDLRISSGYLYLGPAIGLGLLALRYAIEVFAPLDPASMNRDES
jgi:TRAP-type C4-dicarboxylate transport system permease small subunit